MEIVDIFEEYFSLISGDDNIDKRVVRSMIGIMTTFEGKQGYMDPDAFNSGQEMYLYFIHVIDGWMPDTLKNMWDNGTSESEDYVYEKLIEAGNPGIKHD